MTTVLDDKLVPIALAKIDKYGMTATFEVQGLESYDPTTTKMINTSSQKFTRKATPPESWTKRYGPGDVTNLGDGLIWIAASGLQFVPKKNMIVEFDDEAWRVTEIETVKSGDSVCIYGLRLSNNAGEDED